MTRDEAIALGLVRYQPDKPCRKGHNSERYTSTGNCLGCLKQTQSMIAQARNGRAQGWPTVTLQVPYAQVALLRKLVHLLRLHGPEADSLRDRLADHADDLIDASKQPVVECLQVAGGFKPIPVGPFVPTEVEESRGRAQRGKMPLPGLDDATARKFGLLP